MMWIDHDVSAWGFAWMGIGMVAFWGLVIAAVVVLVRHLGRLERPMGERPADRPLPPEQVLAQRFARGEIDEDEYSRRLETLRAGATRSPR
jgi:putative membrane protein